MSPQAGQMDQVGRTGLRRPAGAARAIVNPLRNPVLVRELTQRMRQRRAPVVLTAYLVILTAITSTVYQGAVGSRETPDALVSAAAGRPVFQWVLFFVLMLVCFIVPGVTSGAIAGERERQTLVPVQVTLLSPLGIVGGKLLASLAFVLLLLVATLPLMTVAYAIGGVSLSEILRGMGMAAVVAAVLGCLSVACSAAFRRVQSATVASYVLMLVLAVGTLVAFAMHAVITEGRVNVAFLVGNPFVATANALGGTLRVGELLASPFAGIQQALSAQVSRGLWDVVPFWGVTLLLYAGLAVGSLGLAARRIRVPGATQAPVSRRSRRRGPAGGTEAGREAPAAQPATRSPAEGEAGRREEVRGGEE